MMKGNFVRKEFAFVILAIVVISVLPSVIELGRIIHRVDSR